MISAALLLASVSAGWAELAPMLSGDRQDSQRYEMLAAGSLPEGLSIGARRLALLKCAGAMTSARHRVQPRSRASAVSATCGTLAQDLVAENPADSLAWLTLATVRADAGDIDGFVAGLRRSRQAAPAEQWLAALRVDLAERHRADAGDLALAFIDEDLALMAQSSTGVASIAERYVNQPDFRERITGIVEGLPNRAQANFLEWVEIAATGGSQ